MTIVNGRNWNVIPINIEIGGSTSDKTRRISSEFPVFIFLVDFLFESFGFFFRRPRRD
jgi:hypothetical protein